MTPADSFHKHVQVVAVRQEDPHGPDGPSHMVAVQLRDGTVEDAATVMRKMDSGECVYTMVPPPGAPAYEAHAQTGRQLLLQTRACPDCGERVLFA